MSSRPTPTELIAEAMDEDELVPIGERKAVNWGGSIYVPFPQPHARQQVLEQSSEVEAFLHPQTGALIIHPNLEDK